MCTPCATCDCTCKVLCVCDESMDERRAYKKPAHSGLAWGSKIKIQCHGFLKFTFHGIRKYPNFLKLFE